MTELDWFTVGKEQQIVTAGNPVENDYVTAGNPKQLLDDGDTIPWDTVGDRGLGRTASIIDDFERGNLDPWSSPGFDDIDNWEIGTSSDSPPPYEGDYYALLDTGADHDGRQGIASMPGDGLTAYPEPGQTFTWRVWMGTIDNMDIGYGVQTLDSAKDDYLLPQECYYLFVKPSDDEIKILKRDGPSDDADTVAENIGPDIPINQWLLWEVIWEEDGTQTFTIYEEDGSEVGQTQGQDSTHGKGGVWLYSDGRDFDEPTGFDYGIITDP